MTAVLEYVTASIGGQLFGLPISRVQDVFIPDRLTRVPLASPEIAGLLNVRGRILTVIDMWRRLGLQPSHGNRRPLAVGIEHSGESYGLLIDRIGEVLKLPFPAYTAVIEWEPTARDALLSSALPVFGSMGTAVPGSVGPSLNVTVPVGIPPPGATATTVATNVTG